MDEKFDDHVEQADSNGIGDDDRQGKSEEIFRMTDGFREGEESKEEPKEKFQNKGIHEGPHPQLMMMLFQPPGHEACRYALENGQAPVDKSGIGMDEKCAVEAGNKAGYRAYHRPAYKAGQNDAYGTEIDDAAAGPYIPVGAADGKNGKEDDEKNHIPPAEMLGQNSFTEKGGAAYEQQEKKENGNAEPYMLDADNP